MNQDIIPDASLVTRILDGEVECFELLVARYERLMYSYLLPMVRNIGDVEDIAQEAFLKAYRHLASFDVQRRFSTWLLRIAKNIMIDRYRKDRGTTILAGDIEATIALASPRMADSHNPQADAEHREHFREIFSQICALPEELKAPLLLRIMQELAYTEIAELLDVPLQTVKNRIFKARQMLRAQRGGDHDMPS